MERATERVRHELRFRLARVTNVERITPRMVRVTLHDPDFASFRSDAYDDHVKLFFPGPGEVLEKPVPGPNGLEFPSGLRPEGRDYTPRRFDLSKAEVVIDFVLHGEGPAASWAASAAPGDVIGVGGPRTSFVVRGIFDFYLLAGDETALPAIGRRLEELPRDAKVVCILEIGDAAERQFLDGPQDFEPVWVVRSEGGRLVDAVRQAALPNGTGYAFVAGESAASSATREHLVAERGINPAHIKAAGYWRAGEADFYDGHQH